MPDQDKKMVSFLSKDSKIDIGKANIIQAVTAIQLREIINKNSQTLVYIWAPNCKSKACIPISAAKMFGEKQNYNVIILCEYYNVDILSKQTDDYANIYGVNYKEYNSNICNVYMKRFLKDLIPNGYQRNIGDRFLLFGNGGAFKESKSLLP